MLQPEEEQTLADIETELRQSDPWLANVLGRRTPTSWLCHVAKVLAVAGIVAISVVPTLLIVVGMVLHRAPLEVGGIVAAPLLPVPAAMFVRRCFAGRAGAPAKKVQSRHGRRHEG
jgi:hypothetical protein